MKKFKMLARSGVYYSQQRDEIILVDRAIVFSGVKPKGILFPPLSLLAALKMMKCVYIGKFLVFVAAFTAL